MKSVYPGGWAIPNELDGKFSSSVLRLSKSVATTDSNGLKPAFEVSAIESRLNLLDATFDLMTAGVSLLFLQTTDDGLMALEERRPQVSQEQLIKWGRDLSKYISFMKELPTESILIDHLIFPSDSIKI